MAGCNCDAGGKSTTEKVAGLFLCVKTHQCFVTHIVEKALPILFWLGILGSFIMAFIAAATAFASGSIFGGILILFGVLIADVALTFITFYVIYLLKAIKDSVKSDEEGCGCGCDDEPKKKVVEPKAEPKKEAAPAPKKRGRKPSVKTAAK
jgi:hypothetical protein